MSFIHLNVINQYLNNLVFVDKKCLLFWLSQYTRWAVLFKAGKCLTNNGVKELKSQFKYTAN